MTRRCAAISIPQLPLQLLLKEHPRWRNRPLAITENPSLHAPILYVNRKAQRAGVRIGMSRSNAQDICNALRIGELHPVQLQEAREDLTRALFAFSPRVEESARFVGSWILDPSGLHHIYGDYTTWAQSVHIYLKARQLWSSVVVGFQRYHCLALALNFRKNAVLNTIEEERAAAERVPLRTLQFPGDFVERLALLGVHTLGDFIALPQGELATRFGSQARELHALFSEAHDVPLQLFTPSEPVEIKYQIDPPDADQHRLFFTIKGGLHMLLQQLQARGEKLHTLQICFHLEDKTQATCTVTPAQSTADILAISDLVRLKLEEQTLSDRVEEITLQAQSERAAPQQLPMLDRPKRDVHLARHALAKIRTLFGMHSVTLAKLRDAHLPEAQFAWESSVDVQLPHPTATSSTPPTSAISVRQLLRRPEPLGKHRSAPQQILRYGHVQHLYGPYRLSGGWWKRTVERDYYYADTDTGTWVSLFYDLPRGTWFLHGFVD